MSGSRYPAADNPHFNCSPVNSFIFDLMTDLSTASRMPPSSIVSYNCAQRLGILMKTVGCDILKSFNNELKAGDSANTYVAPQ